MTEKKEWWEDGWNEQFFVLDNEHSCCFKIEDEREEERKRIAEAARRSRIETINEIEKMVERMRSANEYMKVSLPAAEQESARGWTNALKATLSALSKLKG